MGHGVREETSRTRLWYVCGCCLLCIYMPALDRPRPDRPDLSNDYRYVTTGYLVRLASHRPETFKDHSYLIIDEVHERSVDSDILCMLSRRLLDAHPKLKLILMSATVHTAMYQEHLLRGICIGTESHNLPLI